MKGHNGEQLGLCFPSHSCGGCTTRCIFFSTYCVGCCSPNCCRCCSARYHGCCSYCCKRLCFCSHHQKPLFRPKFTPLESIISSKFHTVRKPYFFIISQRQLDPSRQHIQVCVFVSLGALITSPHGDDHNNALIYLKLDSHLHQTCPNLKPAQQEAKTNEIVKESSIQESSIFIHIISWIYNFLSCITNSNDNEIMIYVPKHEIDTCTSATR